jgi:long-subunit acyl-CoA synthetase (AMP-forming)
VTQTEDQCAGTLCEAFQASVARVPARIALRTPGDEVCLSWAEYGAAVERIAGSLAAAGVARGDRVAFYSRNRPELAICEVAALHLGAAGVALYATSSPATLEHVLKDSAPSVLLVESELAPRLAEVCHGVANVLALDGGSCEHRELASLAQSEDFDFEARWRSVQEEDLAALIYTSGTTSLAKGVEWRHLTALGCMRSFDAGCGEPDGICDVSFAPFAHLSERFGGHWHALTRGSTRTVCADPTQLGVALRYARPTRLGGSPQVWQRLQLGLLATLDESERATLEAALEHVGTQTQARNGGEGLDAPAPSEAQEVTLAALRARIGLDRTALAVSTAAPCPPAVHEHYRALGVPLREMFAMTETGVGAGQRDGSLDHGTLGPPLPGYELQIAPDGEVLLRSPTAPRAYRNRPRENAETYGEEGWIHTGDVGELDTEGRLRLIGRKKEMLIPEHGVNVAPARIESALKDACPAIVHVCVLGDGRPHLVALIAIEPEEEEEDEAQRRAAVADAVGEVNETLGPYEQVGAYAVLNDAWLPGAELTETLKLRRTRILERYATTIEELYARSR